MAEQKGWIKIHKKIIDSAVWSDPLRLKAWIHILVSANYEDKDWFTNGRLVRVQRGQYITSIRKLKEAWGCSERTVRRILEQFEELGMIEVQTPLKRYTLLTVVKYSDFQDKGHTKGDIKGDSEGDGQGDTEGDSEGVQLKNSIRHIKNNQEEKEKKTASPVFDPGGYEVEE